MTNDWHACAAAHGDASVDHVSDGRRTTMRMNHNFVIIVQSHYDGGPTTDGSGGEIVVDDFFSHPCL